MWTVDQPLYLLFLALVPVGIYLRHFWPRRGGKLSLAFEVWGGTGFRPRSWAVSTLYGIGVVAFWAAIVAVIIALAGPREVNRERIFVSRGIDMMVVLDESTSMAAQDFQPGNRFTVARSTILDFMDRRENDPIGLVTFGAEAALRVPPTLDYAAVRASLNRMEILSLGDGTAIGMGIALATLHLQRGTAEQRAIILLTDGVNNAGEIDPLAAASLAADAGIRIYPVGIGGTGASAIEFRDPQTGELYRGTFEGGFDEDLLLRIAGITDGQYFSARSPGTLEAVFTAIDQLETIERRVRTDVQTLPRERTFILLALALLGLELIIRRLVLGELL